MDVHTPRQRSNNMAAIRGKNTTPELRVRRLLHRLGYRYLLHAKKLPGTPDLVFPSRKKIVFVHGCYWHCHHCKYGRTIPKTNAEFWANKRARNVARDAEQQKRLRQFGWETLVVWECQTRNSSSFDLEGRLISFLDKRRRARIRK